MFNSDTGTRLVAAAFSVVISAAVFSTIVIPGSPGLFA